VAFACYPWLEFITSVRRMWRPEWGQFNHARARTAWGKYAATAGEFIARERIELEDERASFASPANPGPTPVVGESAAQGGVAVAASSDVAGRTVLAPNGAANG
jgi:hypothetical protein